MYHFGKHFCILICAIFCVMYQSVNSLAFTSHFFLKAVLGCSNLSQTFSLSSSRPTLHPAHLALCLSSRPEWTTRSVSMPSWSCYVRSWGEDHQEVEGREEFKASIPQFSSQWGHLGVVMFLNVTCYPSGFWSIRNSMSVKKRSKNETTCSDFLIFIQMWWVMGAEISLQHMEC